MGRLFVVELVGKAYLCGFCKTPVALTDDLLYKSFACDEGKAFFFRNVVNITFEAEEERRLTTGMHTVQDICCSCCVQSLGWKYVAAHNNNQKYKEGKFILIRSKIMEEGEQDFEAHAISSNGESEEVADNSSLEVHLSSSDGENAWARED